MSAILNPARFAGPSLGWLTVVFVLGATASVWLLSTGGMAGYLTHQLPPGQLLYVLSKLAGLLGFCLLWLQCLVALLRGAPGALRLPPPGSRFHRVFGIATATCLCAHFALFFAAATARSGALAWDLWWPDFSHGHYRTHLSYGVIAFWLLTLGVFAGWRVARGDRRWRWLHASWIVVFVLGFTHAFAIGSESRYGAMRYVFGLMALSLVVALALRLLGALRDRSSGTRLAEVRQS